MCRNALLIEKKLKVQHILKTLIHNTTFARFPNRKAKHNATSVIAEVVLCASNCVLPTSGYISSDAGLDFNSLQLVVIRQCFGF